MVDVLNDPPTLSQDIVNDSLHNSLSYSIQCYPLTMYRLQKQEERLSFTILTNRKMDTTNPLNFAQARYRENDHSSKVEYSVVGPNVVRITILPQIQISFRVEVKKYRESSTI